MTQEIADSQHVRRATVLGGSVSGLMSTFVLAKQGFKVDLYEQRPSYRRNIQWGVRQSFINYLACLDRNMAARFRAKASGVTNGHRFLADRCSFYEHGAYHHRQRSSPQDGTCPDDDFSGTRTLDEEIVCLVPAKELEDFLKSEVERLDDVSVHNEVSPPIRYSDHDDTFFLPDGAAPDLIVVCEGASSPTREASGILSMNLSRPIKQVSGEVYLRRHGMIIEYLHAVPRDARHREELLLSLLISTDRHTASWIVGDVSAACLAELRNVEEGRARAQHIIEQEFRRIAARTMVNAEQNIVEAGYQGAVGQVQLFELQAKISNKAVAGNNLVLAGDAVGVGHWSVGGGVHVAAVCHSKRLEILADSITSGSQERRTALQEYGDGVLHDTTSWISRGIKHYYLSIPGDVLRAVFDELIVELMQGNTIDFPEELKKRVVALYFS